MQYDNARQSFRGSIVARLFPRTFSDRDCFEMQDPEGLFAPPVGIH